MSYIYLPEPAAASLQATSMATAALAPSKSTPTLSRSLSPGKRTARSRHSRSSATFSHSMLNPSEDVLMSFLRDFPVRTSAVPGIERESPGQGLDFGNRSSGWFAKWSPTRCDWKTPQTSLLGGSELFSETWPRWGSMRDGVCYLQPSLAPTISASASGYLLPTLTTIGLNGGSNSRRATAKRGEPPTHLGPLNPDWCEWFMGFPVGWTVFTALETRKFQEWQQQHGAS